MGYVKKIRTGAGAGQPTAGAGKGTAEAQQERVLGYLAERRQAYAEGVLIALCKNSAMRDEIRTGEVAVLAVQVADKMMDELYHKPLAARERQEQEKAKEGKV